MESTSDSTFEVREPLILNSIGATYCGPTTDVYEAVRYAWKVDGIRVSMAIENCTLLATENCTLRGETSRAAGTFGRRRCRWPGSARMGRV